MYLQLFWQCVSDIFFRPTHRRRSPDELSENVGVTLCHFFFPMPCCSPPSLSFPSPPLPFPSLPSSPLPTSSLPFLPPSLPDSPRAPLPSSPAQPALAASSEPEQAERPRRPAACLGQPSLLRRPAANLSRLSDAGGQQPT